MTQVVGISEWDGQMPAAITKCMLKNSNDTPEEDTVPEMESLFANPGYAARENGQPPGQGHVIASSRGIIIRGRRILFRDWNTTSKGWSVIARSHTYYFSWSHTFHFGRGRTGCTAFFVLLIVRDPSQHLGTRSTARTPKGHRWQTPGDVLTFRLHR